MSIKIKQISATHEAFYVLASNGKVYATNELKDIDSWVELPILEALEKLRTKNKKK